MQRLLAILMDHNCGCVFYYGNNMIPWSLSEKLDDMFFFQWWNTQLRFTQGRNRVLEQMQMCFCVYLESWETQADVTWLTHPPTSTSLKKDRWGAWETTAINLFWIHEFISLFIHSSFFLSLNLFPDNISLQYSYNCKIFVGFFSVWCVWNWGCDLGEDKKDRDRSWWQRDWSGVVSRKSCY